jgi:hypothetical protein
MHNIGYCVFLFFFSGSTWKASKINQSIAIDGLATNALKDEEVAIEHRFASFSRVTRHRFPSEL